MPIQIHFEHSDPITLEDEIRGINTDEELAQLFEGECYLSGAWIETCQIDDDADQIVSAHWVDADPPTSFHGYVLDYMNNTDIAQIISVAEGNSDSHKVMEAIANYFHGFQEAVDDLIKTDGLEFVFGNGFCLTTLFDFVVREIIRDYLRKHEIADI